MRQTKHSEFKALAQHAEEALKYMKELESHTNMVCTILPNGMKVCATTHDKLTQLINNLENEQKV